MNPFLFTNNFCNDKIYSDYWVQMEDMDMANLLEELRMQMFRKQNRDMKRRQSMNRNQTFDTWNQLKSPQELKTKALEEETISDKALEERISNKEEKEPIVVNNNIDTKPIEKEDSLISQIDEFRMKAEQLQQLLNSKKEKAARLEELVSEREGKAVALEQIVKERQNFADEFNESVGKKIDGLVMNVDSHLTEIKETMDDKFDEVKDTMSMRLDAHHEKSEESAGEIKSAITEVSSKVEEMSGMTDHMDTMKADLYEKIHSESVQSYRNVSEILKSIEGRLNQLEEIEKKEDKLQKTILAILVFTIINLLGLVVNILMSLGIIVF